MKPDPHFFLAKFKLGELVDYVTIIHCFWTTSNWKQRTELLWWRRWIVCLWLWIWPTTIKWCWWSCWWRYGSRRALPPSWWLHVNFKAWIDFCLKLEVKMSSTRAYLISSNKFAPIITAKQRISWIFAMYLVLKTMTTSLQMNILCIYVTKFAVT